MKKRILFMHQSSAVGGGSFCLLNIVKALDRNSFIPVVALKNEGPLVKEFEKVDVEVVLFEDMSSIPYNSPLFRPFSISHYFQVFVKRNKLKKLLVEKEIDVIYLNNMMIYPYLKIARSIGVKTVIHIREHWPLNEHKYQLSWARKNVYRYADKVIAINHYSASMFPGVASTIVYDWIDMSKRFKPMPLNKIFGEDVSNKKVLLFTGGFDPIKGVYEIVETFTKFVEGSDYRLLILGTPLDENTGNGWKSMLRMAVYSLKGSRGNNNITEMIGNDNRIKCIPAVYELSHLIKQSTCFVSYFKIPHANLALAENIILGNACIAARTDESEEYSMGGKAAMLVSFGDKTEFRDKLLQLLKEIDKWKTASCTYSDKVAEMFSTEDNILKINKTLLDLTSN